MKRAFGSLPPWVVTRRFRADSAVYDTPLLKVLVAEHVGFAISADVTKERRACCLEVPATHWTPLDTREREQVDLAEVEFTPGDWTKTARPCASLRCALRRARSSCSTRRARAATPS